MSNFDITRRDIAASDCCAPSSRTFRARSGRCNCLPGCAYSPTPTLRTTSACEHSVDKRDLAGAYGQVSLQRSCRHTSSRQRLPALRQERMSSNLPALSGRQPLRGRRFDFVQDPGPNTVSTINRNCSAGRHPGGRRSAFGVAGAIAAQPRCPASRERPGPHAGVLHDFCPAPPERDEGRSRLSARSRCRTSRERHGPRNGALRSSQTAPPERGVVRILTLRWLISHGA